MKLRMLPILLLLLAATSFGQTTIKTATITLYYPNTAPEAITLPSNWFDWRDGCVSYNELMRKDDTRTTFCGTFKIRWKN